MHAFEFCNFDVSEAYLHITRIDKML